MNRLYNLKYDLSQRHFNTFGQGAFVEGFDAASAEYEKIITKLEKVLIVSKGAMAYAYEDHGDRFYLNVKEDIEKALQKLKEFRG